MSLSIPQKVAWRRYIDRDPFFSSSRKSKRLTSFLKKIQDLSISYEIINLHEEKDFYEWFTTCYATMLNSKTAPLKFDVTSYTLYDGQQIAPKCALLLMENGVRIGATIFFVMKKSLNIAFKTYPTNWEINQSLQIGPSLYSEYLLYEHARQCRREFISSGVDRNMYGLHADIGLASFKFSAGYNPRMVANPEYIEIDQSTIKTDTLVFLADTDEAGFITKAKLFANDFEQYTMLLKSGKNVEIDTVKL